VGKVLYPDSGRLRPCPQMNTRSCGRDVIPHERQFRGQGFARGAPLAAREEITGKGVEVRVENRGLGWNGLAKGRGELLGRFQNKDRQAPVKSLPILENKFLNEMDVPLCLGLTCCSNQYRAASYPCNLHHIITRRNKPVCGCWSHGFGSQA